MRKVHQSGSAMRVRVCVTPAALGILGLVLLWEQPVAAYFDPGSGSLIYQALLAGLLGLGFTFRRLIGLFARARGRTAPPPLGPPAPPPDPPHAAP